MTPFSLYDNDFAKLQNSVSDLEELVKLEKNKLAAESRKNTEFISDISHQLKTPIAAIKLYCEMDNETKPSTHNTEFSLLKFNADIINSLNNAVSAHIFLSQFITRNNVHINRPSFCFQYITYIFQQSYAHIKKS